MANFINIIKNLINKIVNWKYFYPSIIMIYILMYVSPIVRYYVKGDDLSFHLYNFELLRRSSVFSKIVPNAANNLGWGVGLFYPPLMHILGSVLLKIFPISHLVSLKIINVLIIISSGLIMYFLTYKLFNNRKYACISSLFYLSSSYFLMDFYVRDALNELALFFFVPLVFLSFYYLFKENKIYNFYLCFISGYIGIIYCHLMMGVMFTILIIPFLLIYIKDIIKKHYLKNLILASLIVLFFTSTFIFPLFVHMQKNLWFIPAYKSVWVLPYRGYFIYDLYKTSSNGLLFIKLNVVLIILFVLSIKNIIIKKKDKYLIGILIFTVLSLFLSGFAPFWKFCPSFLKNIQFAWRLNLYSTVGICLLIPKGLKSFYNIFKTKYHYIATIFILIIVLVFTYNNFLKVNFKRMEPITFSNNIIEANHDYYPKKAKNHLNYLSKLDSKKIEVFSKENIKIKIISNKPPELKFKVSNLDGVVKLQLPRLYYLGYKIVDSKGHYIKYYETKYGLIGLNINKNDTYTLKYVGIDGYIVALFLKGVSVLLIISLFISYAIMLKKRNK